MSDIPRSPDQMKARGFSRIAIVFLILSLLLLTAAAVVALDTPRIFAATDVTEEDFTNKTSQAILTGTMQISGTRMTFDEETEMGVRLTGGRNLTVLTPFTEIDWTVGDLVSVVIVSPTITGVTEDNMQDVTRGYMNELTSKPDNIMVTLLPEDTRAALANRQSERNGITQETLYVWADHVSAINFGPTKDPFGFLPAIIAFLIAFCFFIASRVFKRRATRTQAHR